MSISLDKFRAKLVIKILYAQSSEEIGRFIKAAIKAMNDRKVNGYIIKRFVDKIIHQLSHYSPANTASQRWKNSMTAKFLLLEMRDAISLTAV